MLTACVNHLDASGEFIEQLRFIFQSIIWNFRILFLFLHRVEPAKPLNEAQIGGSFFYYEMHFLISIFSDNPQSIVIF